MAISFPSNPSNGQIFTDPTSGNQYQWNGTVWVGRSPLTISGDFVGIGSTVPQFPLTVGFSTLGVDPVAGAAATSLYVQGSVTVTDRISAAKIFGVHSLNLPTGDYGDLSASSADSFGISTISRFDVSREPSSFDSLDLGIIGSFTYDSVQWAQSNAGIHTLSNVGVGTTNPTTNLQVEGNVNVSGAVTASNFVGDGSGLTGVVGSGSGVIIKDSGSLVGTAGSIDFGTNLSVSPISAGLVTVTASATGGGETYWSQTLTGIHTLSNVGVGTTNPTNSLSVTGDVNITRHLNVAGVITSSSLTVGSAVTINSGGVVAGLGTINYIDGTQVNVTGVITASSALLTSTTIGSGVTINSSGIVAGLGTVNYINATHVNATGVITATSFSGSNTLKSRTTVSGATTAITNNGIGNTNITGYKSYALMKVGLSTAGWLRLYTDSTSRANDVSRSVGEDPAAGSGVVAEVVTTGVSTTQVISPFVMGGNMDDPADTTIYAAVTNLSGLTTSISVNLTLLQLEA